MPAKLIGRRWYSGRLGKHLILEWDDITIRNKCRQGTRRLHEAFLASGYCIKVVNRKAGSLEVRLGELKRPESTTPDNITVSGVTIAEVIKSACQKYNITKREIMSHSKQKNFCMARREVIYYCYVVLKKSSKQIGIALGRDHTSVLHHVFAMRKHFRGKITNPNPKLATIDQRSLASVQGAKYSLQTGEAMG